MAHASITRGRKMVDVRNDYEGFVEKFKPKLTTDDCYTPPAVYDAVLNYVRTELDPLEGCTIRRPFKPGGDYQAEAEGYGPNDVVVDNPPFSLTAQIVRFYVERGIRFFIFAPGLTLFQKPQPGVTYVVVGTQIRYENGVSIPTSFITNMEGKHRIITSPSLHRSLSEASSQKKRAKLGRRITYPLNVITPSKLNRLCAIGHSIKIPVGECEYTHNCDNGKESIFGGGYFVSDNFATSISDCLVDVHEVVELSEREREIIARLSKNTAQNSCPNG